MLTELGAPVVDADLVARQIVEPGQPAYDDIVRELGESVLGADRAIDRKRLGALVFGDETKRRWLNSVDPSAHRAGVAGAAIAATGAELVIYEAALIVENGLHRGFAGLIVVAVPPELQLLRVMARDHLDEAAARARLTAQLPLADKIAVATHVIEQLGLARAHPRPGRARLGRALRTTNMTPTRSRTRTRPMPSSSPASRRSPRCA